MSTARGGLAAAADAQGNIYAIGGTNGIALFFSTVEMYSPATNTWSAAPSMPTSRAHFAAVADGRGNIYAIGGFSSNPLSKEEEFLPRVTSYTFIKN